MREAQRSNRHSSYLRSIRAGTAARSVSMAWVLISKARRTQRALAVNGVSYALARLPFGSRRLWRIDVEYALENARPRRRQVGPHNGPAEIDTAHLDEQGELTPAGLVTARFAPVGTYSSHTCAPMAAHIQWNICTRRALSCWRA